MVEIWFLLLYFIIVVILFYCYILSLLEEVPSQEAVKCSGVCLPFWFFSVEQININRHSNQQFTP